MNIFSVFLFKHLGCTMKKLRLLLLAFLVYLPSFANDFDAEVSAEPLRQDTAAHTWINAGLGTSIAYPLAFNIGLNYQRNRNMWTFRFLVTDEMDLINQSSSESVWDTGLLYGHVFSHNNYQFSLSAGLSFVGGLKRGIYLDNEDSWGGYFPMKHRATIGIPFESHWTYLLSNNVGIGIATLGNLNLDKSFLGVMLNLQIGILQ